MWRVFGIEGACRPRFVILLRNRSGPGRAAMKDSAKYAKIVEWSEEDRCCVGSAPGLIHGGCHGDDERQVFAELCEIVEVVITTT
jgi:hypothetical protein